MLFFKPLNIKKLLSLVSLGRIKPSAHYNIKLHLKAKVIHTRNKLWRLNEQKPDLFSKKLFEFRVHLQGWLPVLRKSMHFEKCHKPSVCIVFLRSLLGTYHISQKWNFCRKLLHKSWGKCMTFIQLVLYPARIWICACI